MEETKDLYGVLGITDEEKKLQGDDFNKVLKKKYRSASLKWHPDRNMNNKEEAEKHFKEVVEAYDVLSNPQKRQQYDMFGTVGGNNADGGFGMGMNMEDIMEHFKRHMSGMSDFFGMGGGMDMGERDIKKVRVTLSLKEIYSYGTKTIKYDIKAPCKHCGGKGYGKNGKLVVCPTCGGQGMVVETMNRGFSMMQRVYPCPHCQGAGHTISNPCPHCKGTGLENVKKALDIQIPYGVMDNSYTIVKGEGNISKEGAAGDLLIMFRIEADKEFQISANNPFDIVYRDYVPVLDCITGCERNIEHLDGKKYRYALKPCTDNGNVVKLVGKGLMRQDGSCGDLYIVINVKMPTSISDSDKKIIEGVKNKINFK